MTDEQLVPVEYAPGFKTHPDEVLAIMRDVKYGVVDDRWPHPSLHFEVEMLAGCTRLSLSEEESRAMIVQTLVEDVKRLSGRLCVVYRDDGYIRFLRLHS